MVIFMVADIHSFIKSALDILTKASLRHCPKHFQSTSKAGSPYINLIYYLNDINLIYVLHLYRSYRLKSAYMTASEKLAGWDREKTEILEIFKQQKKNRKKK